VEIFNLEAIGRAAGVFDPEKLLALNADHIKATPPAGLVPALAPFMRAHGIEIAGDPRTEKAIATLQPRSKTLKEMADQALFYFQDEVSYEAEAVRKFLTAEALPVLAQVQARLTALEDYSEAGLEAAFKAVMAETGLKLGKIAQPVRVALSGRAASPGLFEITAIIGKQATLARLQRAIDTIRAGA
jgi:glutamyl-tRNA synthetase